MCVCVLFKMHPSVSLCFSRNVKVDFECHGAAIYPLKRRRRYLHFPLSKRKVASLSIFVFFHAFCATFPWIEPQLFFFFFSLLL